MLACTDDPGEKLWAAGSRRESASEYRVSGLHPAAPDLQKRGSRILDLRHLHSSDLLCSVLGAAEGLGLLNAVGCQDRQGMWRPCRHRREGAGSQTNAKKEAKKSKRQRSGASVQRRREGPWPGSPPCVWPLLFPMHHLIFILSHHSPVSTCGRGRTSKQVLCLKNPAAPVVRSHPAQVGQSSFQGAV